MSASASPRVVLTAIGNQMRHDDGAGPAVAKRVAQFLKSLCGEPGVTVESPLSGPLDVLEAWDGADLAIVVDAVRSGQAPGTVSLTWLDRASARSSRQAGARRPSTHGLSLVDVYLLTDQIAEPPGRVALIGVEGADFSHGEGLSAPVEHAVTRAASLVLQVAQGALQPVQPVEPLPANARG